MPPVPANRSPACPRLKNARKGTGKTRSLSKTIGCPMIDKDPQMIR